MVASSIGFMLGSAKRLSKPKVLNPQALQNLKSIKSFSLVPSTQIMTFIGFVFLRNSPPVSSMKDDYVPRGIDSDGRRLALNGRQPF